MTHPAPGPTPVERGLLESILVPYKPNCKYLRAAEVEYAGGGDERPEDFVARAEGRFEIPASCYIDDTGHLNSVEFNISYNQLVYVLLAQCIVDEAMPELAGMTIDEYRRRQLPDVLIHDLSSVFRKAMDSRRFRGEVVIHSVRDRRRFVFIKSTCRFWDEAGGSCAGEISLAIVNRSDPDELTADPHGNGHGRNQVH